MKTSRLLGIGLCLAACAPAATQAGVKVDIRFGTARCGPYVPAYCAPPPVFCGPRPYAWRGPVCGPRVVYVPAYYSAPERVVVVRETAYAPPPAIPAARQEPSYASLGRDWARDLRNDVATWEQFVAWLRANLVRAPANAYAEFREGFLAAYGVNAEAAFNKAYAEAR